MARVYATADDVINWIGDYPPANVDVLLARASLVVEELVMGVVYDTDVNGLPTDAGVIATMRDAVCAQVQWWVPGMPAVGDSSSEDGWPRMSRASRPDPTMASGKQPGRPEVAPDVGRILHVAGMFPSHARLLG